MSASVASLTRCRNVDYARLNSRGFQSLKLNKTRSRVVKNGGVVGQLLGSGTGEYGKWVKKQVNCPLCRKCQGAL